MHLIRPKGFTLIEVLVAMAALALMAGLSWRSLDVLLKTQSSTQLKSDALMTVQAGLAQWDADLNAIVESGVVNGLEFDGLTLRLTRRDAQSPGSGLRVVSWTQRNRNGESVWVRWQSPLSTTRQELNGAWVQAGAATTPDRADAVTLMAISQWQVYYFRKNAWVNPLSANEQANAEALTRQTLEVAEQARRLAVGLPGATGAPRTDLLAVPQLGLGLLPDGVRVVLELAPGNSPALTGSIRKDWVRPQFVPSPG